MATYSDKSFNASRYNSARPSYPDEFYNTLMNYHNEGKSSDLKLAVDIGCGSGFVTFKLAEYFENVIGTDLSATMIESCNKNNTKHKNVKFLVGPAEDSPKEIGANSVSMLTGAECCHWVDHARFFKESHRVLQPGGTLAYWFYKDPIFVDFPKANAIYDKYCYGEEIGPDGSELYMGPSWEQPGRNFLRTLLKEVEVPTDLYTDIVRNEYHADRNSEKTSLYIARTVNLQTVLEYVQSWSAYHTWMKKYGSSHKDIAEQFVDELRAEMGWLDDFQFEIVWDTVYTFARKK